MHFEGFRGRNIQRGLMGLPRGITLGAQSASLAIVDRAAGREGRDTGLYPRLFGSEIAQTVFVVSDAPLDGRRLAAPGFYLP
jgi:hypothetical protein